MDWAALPGAQLALGFEVRAARAIPAFIDPFAYPAVVIDALHDLGDDLGVAGI